jgi:hypothetical protein
MADDMAGAMNFERGITVDTPFIVALARTREAPAGQGFGVLS